MLLCFDTETTGLPDWKSPSEADHQPHLVQLAMILLDDDLTERACVNLIIRPDGWTISDEVAAIHGITHKIACDYGVPEKTATMLFTKFAYDLGAKPLAHNLDFDLRIMRIAMLRAGFEKAKLDDRKLVGDCTMKKALPILNLPPTAKMRAAGFNKPKQPNLGECVQYFFGETLEGAHDAMVDARACLRVYQKIQALADRAPIAMKDPIGTALGAEDVI